MTTKQNYRDTLDRLHVKVVTRLLDKRSEVEASHPVSDDSQINKVACIVAAGELRDGLEKQYGKGNVPIDALLAMRDYMGDWK
jgi:hypothetical protein